LIDVFLQTVPFFGLIALGYMAVRSGFFTAEATAIITKFVFYFALPAMLRVTGWAAEARDVEDGLCWGC